MTAHSNKEPVKITAFEVENVKRVKAVSLDCSGQSLTIIGGRNAQGKTSVLDAIMWTLGGDRFKPSDALREGAEKLATKITMTNGIIVERRGVNGALKVTGPDGKGGQNLLNEFVSAIALDLPRFMNASAREKANMLLDLYPELGAELNRLNQEAKRIYDERHALGVILERKKKYAEELPFHHEAPNDLLTGTEMTQRLQDQLRQNSENDRLRREIQSIRIAYDSANKEVDRLRDALAKAHANAAMLGDKLDRAEKAAVNINDADTTAIQNELEQIDAINAKVRQNLDKARAEAEADTLAQALGDMSNALDEVRSKRLALLASLQMPLPHLSINESGDLMFQDRKWDCMSGSEQLRVAAAICASIKPECGFVLLDGLERMDVRQLAVFADWLEDRGLQAIGTRVSEGAECSIIIEDGVATEVTEAEYEFK